MKTLSKFINKNVSGKKVLGLFILTNLVYAFMLIVTIPKTMSFANGMKLLDMMPAGYDFNYVNTLFSALGNNGRDIYLTNQIPVDMIYPFLFGVSYAAVMAYFLNKINKLNTPFIYLSLLPIIAGIADYIENIGIISMLNNYPNLTETTVNTISTFSIIKSISTSVFFIALVVVLILVFINFFKKSK
ncbi:hypothetical protein [Seonamhaeicola maritimus]|uniref:DUF4386 domain-containing protein n=1 Tax=Seonamhaeicola maritimus TaxID=2591822 RepID=A0A5C7GN70_9FLAO|nr:hypothetical protein [Seonamhaeicola maritimus]TXG39720.1 hypothetical protein FUA22_07595 [Seonamhaeicola maritimus]